MKKLRSSMAINIIGAIILMLTLFPDNRGNAVIPFIPECAPAPDLPYN